MKGRTLWESLAGARKGKPSKYRNVPTEVDGIRFSSRAESRFYIALKAERSAGVVSYFLRQVPIHLPGDVRYVVDFLVFYPDGRARYVDVKGVQTAMFRRNKKQVEALYPIQIEVVK
jgi:hypothetical protein